MNTDEFKRVRLYLESQSEKLAKSELSNFEQDEIFRILEEVFNEGYDIAMKDAEILARRGDLM